MSPITVDAILDQIRQLPAADRAILEQRLAEQTESEWREEAESWCATRAREKGISQATIDQAVHDLRYGK